MDRQSLVVDSYVGRAGASVRPRHLCIPAHHEPLVVSELEALLKRFVQKFVQSLLIVSSKVLESFLNKRDLKTIYVALIEIRGDGVL